MVWSFVLTDLSGSVLGEITSADQRKVSLPHMRVPTASFVMPLWHPLADTVLGQECLLKCYRADQKTLQKNLAFIGPVISVEEVGDNTTQTISVNAAGPFWRLTKRIIPGSLSKSGFAYGTEAAQVDLGQIAHMILTDINGPNFTGVSVGSRENTINGFYTCPPMKNAAEAMAELAAGVGSYEFNIRPTEPTNVAGSGGWPQIGVMDIYAMVGTVRPDAIFEYGTTRANVAGYNRPITHEGMVNKAYISVNGWPDGTTQDIRSRQDDTSITNRGLYEEVVNDAGVTDDGLRDSIAQYHVDIRKDPRQLITFKPATNARPAPFVDYNVGDQVRARAFIRGSQRFDSMFRIWGISFDIDKNGNESIELELVMP